MVERVITSEEQAYALLQEALSGALDDISLRFEGWPSLHIHLEGAKFDRSLTPTVMKSLLEFQKGLYHAYASVRYNDPLKRLTDTEKNALEIKVTVGPGSSDLSIPFSEISKELLAQLVGKMTGTEVLIAVISVALLFFGTSALRSFLDNRKDVRLKEIGDETLRSQLQTMQFQSTTEVERVKVITQALATSAAMTNIGRIAHDTQTELVRGTGEAVKVEIGGVELTGKNAVTLVHNARRKSDEVRLDGHYRLLKLDWSDMTQFKVRIRGANGDELEADVQDESMAGDAKQILQKAEWRRVPVWLEINARRVGTEIRSATIVRVKAVEDEASSEVSR